MHWRKQFPVALQDTVVWGDAPHGDKDAALSRRISCAEGCVLILHFQCLLLASCADLLKPTHPRSPGLFQTPNAGHSLNSIRFPAQLPLSLLPHPHPTPAVPDLAQSGGGRGGGWQLCHGPQPWGKVGRGGHFLQASGFLCTPGGKQSWRVCEPSGCTSGRNIPAQQRKFKLLVNSPPAQINGNSGWREYSFYLYIGPLIGWCLKSSFSFCQSLAITIFFFFFFLK